MTDTEKVIESIEQMQTDLKKVHEKIGPMLEEPGFPYPLKMSTCTIPQAALELFCRNAKG